MTTENFIWLIITIAGIIWFENLTSPEIGIALAIVVIGYRRAWKGRE